MRWKSLLWAVCPLPDLTGCTTTFGAADPASTEVDSSHARRGLDRDPRRDAQATWQAVVAGYPGRPFTDEFRDGFVDGYVDCRARGGAAEPPTVPPLPYGRDRKYQTPEGQSLIRDYYLGFTYGINVAALAAPRPVAGDGSPLVRLGQSAVLKYGKPNPEPPGPSSELAVVDKAGGPKTWGTAIPADGRLAAAREPDAGRSGSAVPKHELPVIEPFNPDLSAGKFSAPPVAPSADLLPAPNPPLAVRPANLTTEPSDPPHEALAPAKDSLPLILRNITVTPYRRPPPTPDDSPADK